jgi:rod shape determining protein RodA
VLDYSIFKYIWKYLYVFGALFLIITFLFAEFRSGSARWLTLGSVNFQTSEFAKLTLVVSLASYISDKRKSINSAKTLFFIFLMTIIYVLLIFNQPDLGTSLVVITVALGVLFYAGLKKVYFVVSLLVAGIFSAPLWSVLKDYQQRRIIVFLNPQLDVLGSGYNVIQSIIAIGSGGLTGKGFGQGTQANLKFLPAYWTDFIFASFAEEWGFIGVFVFISLFTFLLFWILKIANETGDLFGKLICIGVFMIFFIQFVINVGMNLGIMPVTGVTLPLVSYGGSSMLFSMIMLGIVHNVWYTGSEKI